MNFCKRVAATCWRCWCIACVISGRQNIPAEGGVLVVSNHQSHLDPPLVGIGCPRQMNYLARDTLFRFAPFAMADPLGRRHPDRPRRHRLGRDQGVAASG